MSSQEATAKARPPGYDEVFGDDPEAALVDLARAGGLIAGLVDARYDEMVGVRRDIHAHPEVSNMEFETTGRIAAVLRAEGLEPQFLPGTGLICDVLGSDPSLAPVGLRADIDALPVQDRADVPFRSLVADVSHACGHDVHASVVLGAGIVLNALRHRGLLLRTVRLVFQPAEEVQPSGAREVLASGAVDSLSSIFALHCDPRTDVGRIGVRPGSITSAADHVEIHFAGRGGHTSRPHLTEDLIYAMGAVVTQVPAALSRRLDPRSGVNLTWGSIHAGNASNAIPGDGVLSGTLRCLDIAAWDLAGSYLAEVIQDVARPFGVEAKVLHDQGVPPVVNDSIATAAMARAARASFGDAAVETAEQSLGGEDFSWYLTRFPGALARLGTRTPGGRSYDLHMGDLTVDEDAIRVGMRFMTATALFAGI